MQKFDSRVLFHKGYKMNIRWLQDFITLADCQKFTVAAQISLSSQAAFSRRIQQLEQYLDVALFDRKKTPIRLTEEGKKLYPIALEMIDIAENCKKISENKKKYIVVASLHTLACNFFPEWYKKLHTQLLESVIVKIDSGIRSVSNYHAALESGRANLLLFYNSHAYDKFFPITKFDKLTISTEKLIWVCGSDFDLELLKSKSIPYLSYSETTQLSELSQPLINKTPGAHHLNTIFISTISESMIPMVKQNFSIACVPYLSAKESILNGDLIQIWNEHTQPLEVVLIKTKGETDDNYMVREMFRLARCLD